MSKEEFLTELRESLTGKMSSAAVESNVDYYRAYIEGEMMKGRSEDEILEELGPARLIAKTLTAGIKDNERADAGHRESSHAPYGQSGYEQEDPGEEIPPRGAKIKRVISIIITVLIILFVAFLFFGMFRGLLYLFIRFLPIIVIAIIILSVYRGTRWRG